MGIWRGIKVAWIGNCSVTQPNTKENVPVQLRSDQQGCFAPSSRSLQYLWSAQWDGCSRPPTDVPSGIKDALCASSIIKTIILQKYILIKKGDQQSQCSYQKLRNTPQRRKLSVTSYRSDHALNRICDWLTDPISIELKSAEIHYLFLSRSARSLMRNNLCWVFEHICLSMQRPI